VAYRADIEIAVKGAQELKRLGDQISATGKLVDGLNKYLENIGGGGVVRSINNLNETVGKAAAAFNKAALGTQEATLAARNYIAATDDLNNGLRERLSLLKQVNDAERQQRLSSAGIRETTQYGGPIGPGPASSVLGGQSTPVDERIRRNLEGRKDELLLQQALLALEEKSAAAANKELQARGEIARLAAQGVNAAAFRAAQTGTALALPAFQERGLQLLDDSVRLNESNRRIEQALNGERQRGVRFLEKQTAEERRQVELGILGARTGALSGSARATGAVPAGGFPVSGPLQSPGFRNTQKQVGKFGENLALGAGFPLLFGGGPGSVAGSVLGSFVGSGFGGQILGGAIGQILDQAIQKTAQLGSALQTLDISQIEQSGVRINANLETQIDLVRQAGNAYAAQQLLQQEVFATTGAIPGTIEGITNSVNVLSSAWSEFTAAAGATLGIIGAPFAAALGAAIRIVNLIVKGFNVAASGLAGLIQKTGEWVVELVAGGEALKNIQNFFESLNPAIDEARGKYAPILSDLNSQVLLNRQLLELEKQKTTGKTSDDKDRNVDLTTQQRILTINAEIDNDIREINKGITEATKTQVAEAVRLLNVKRNQKLEEVQIEAFVQRQRIAEDARDKAARDAEKAAREAARAAEDAARAAEQRTKAILNANKEYLSDQVKAVDLNTKQIEVFKGVQAALVEQLNLTQTTGRLRTQILETERDLALIEAEKLGLTSAVTQQYALKFKLLQAELNIEYKLTEQKLEQTKLDKQLRADQLQRSKEEAIRGIQVQQDKVQLDIAAFTEDPKAVEIARLSLDQITRAYEAELPILTEIDTLQRQIQSGAYDEDTVAIKNQELALQQSKLNGIREELTLLDSLEQRQLSLQQFYQTYGQLIQSVSGEIANAVTFGVSEMVRGTKTAEQVFSEFLNAVGAALIQAAQQMIATYIAIGIAKIFAGFGGGGGGFAGNAAGFGGSFDAGIPSIGNTTSFAGVFGRANGGPVTSQQPYIVGERGPELFVPGTGGSVVNNNDLRSAMGAASGSGNGAPVLNMSFQSTNINGVEYVSRDQLEQAMAQTRRQASRDGAQRGMSMTLDKLQQSPSTRNRVGIR
jgi:hypothetical protein